MKTSITGLGSVLAILALALGPRIPVPPAMHGLDPALGCVSDVDCRTALRLVGWPKPGPRARASIAELSVTNGGPRFRGDRRLLATISPNGDGIRERAAIRFRLTRDATVKLLVTRAATRARIVHLQTRRLKAGYHTLYWSPTAALPARTYLTYLAVHDRVGWRIYGSRTGDPRRRQQTPVVRVLGVDAAFRGDSYSTGDRARLRVAADAERLTLQIFHVGPERVRTFRNDELNGIPVTDPVTLRWQHRRSRPQTLRVAIGSWPTGVYFARLVAGDGRVGFAPFVVRPPRLGANRVAVVLPTYTWQAYNLTDTDGDGWGESWYVHQARTTVRLGRSHLARGVPMAFRHYDLPFLHWLAWNERAVDYLAQGDVARSSGAELSRAYDLMIFPGHHEYVTRAEYDAVAGFRNLGGNLMFLSANNFFWRVDRKGQVLRRVAQWRDLRRPEAALIGVQYVANGRHRAPYRVRDTASNPWLFEGTEWSEGTRFGHFGTEVDRLAPSSPRGTRVLAEIRDLFGPGLSAHMTYYETDEGARVFAAGAFTLAGSATRSYGERLLDNLWRHMTSDRGDAAYGYAAPARRQPLEAAFARESYRPGERATLRLWGRPREVAVQIFRAGPERLATRRNDELKGVAVSDVRTYRASGAVAVRIGAWPTGVYFARVRAAGGNVAFAPLVVRPARLGEHRVAVVMPTLTWQAYNFRDDDRDGRADSWYADRSRDLVRLNRPFLHRGVPLRFRAYDLPFLHWLAWGEHGVDYLAQRDVERVGSLTLRRRYDLIVFPGHHEYVTRHEYEAITSYRDLGGNLMFLSANNFFWRVERRGDTLRKIAMWRDLGRPEAALVGVQYVTYGRELRGPYKVRNARATPWLFRGTGLRNGSHFGTFGIEIDRVAPASPRRTLVLAEIHNGHGPDRTGQMSYYETRRGAKVFAAGAFTLGGSATRGYGAGLLDNLWRHMTQG